MYKICVVTATRAEYGLLRPLLFRFKNNDLVDLQLIVMGTHLVKQFGNTQNEIISDGFTNYLTVEIPLDDDSKKGMAIATGSTTLEFAALFEKITPDMVVILGDRYEMLGVATAAHLSGIPIAHLCGGDVTVGAVDDAIRHCITKLSVLHFPGCEQSAKRIIQMGENPSRVFNVGEPGVENCLNTELLSRSELFDRIGIKNLNKDYCVVTFHPVTTEEDSSERQVGELIKAMDFFPDLAYIITKANADAGGRIINEIWEKEAKSRENWIVVSSLGVQRYLSAVKYAQLVIGTSSSGLVEVPFFKVPTINIGDRQKGRMMAISVLNCNPKAEDIICAMKNGFNESFRESIINMDLPFGDGTTSVRVEKIIMDFLKTADGNIQKDFYDIAFSVR